MIKARSVIATLFSLSIALPAALALEGPNIQNFKQALAFLGKMLQGIFDNEYALFVVTVGLAFILFYVLWGVVVQRTHLFRGQGGIGMSGMGRLFSIAAAGLTCTAIFAMQADVTKTTMRFLAPIGITGAVIFSILIFLLVWRGFRDQQLLGLGNFTLGLIGGILAWVFFSFLMGNANMLGWGVILLGIFLIGLIVRGVWRWRHAGATPHAVQQAERGEARAERETQQRQQHEQQDVTAELQQLRAEMNALRRDQLIRDAAIETLARRLGEAARGDR